MTTTSNPRSNDPDRDRDKGAAYGEKLIPEWRVGADDQVFLAGLAVVAALLLAFGWSIWRGNGDGDVASAASTILDSVGDADVGLDDGATGSVVPVPVDADSSDDASAEEEAAEPTTTTTEAPTTTVPVIGDVQAAVDPFPGAITGSNDGSIALLTGFVANQGESDEAEAAAAAVAGIDSVDNQLVILEPEVASAMQSAGVTGASASGNGTEITVSGTIDTEDDRQPALDAAAAVPGVTSIIDNRLEVSVTADLNLLPQVQFATNSAEILAVSHGDLDSAAELLMSADPSTRIEVQGYTDVRGDEQANLELSQARADSVREYLIGAGVDEAMLAATGYGETTEFAEGDTAEAYAANRLVRFQQVG